MTMSAIVTADIHQNEKPSDEYRWPLFDWLVRQEADELIIAGDLCDAKDRHGARLVNRLHEKVDMLRRRFSVVLLKGNHDYYDINHPFWAFLGRASRVVYVAEPTELRLSIGSAMFMPAGAKWDFELPDVDYLFTHATFSGAKAENGRTLTGVDPCVLDGFCGKVYSGDVHVPQTLLRGKLTYVGAPYHTRFGDDFEPRVLCIADDGSMKDLHFPAPHKLTFIVTKPADLLDEKAREGDHVKVKVLLRRSEYVHWRDYQKEIRAIAAERGWRLFGVEPSPIGDAVQVAADGNGPVMPPEDLVADYCRRQKAGKAFLSAGHKMLREIL